MYTHAYIILDCLRVRQLYPISLAAMYETICKTEPPKHPKREGTVWGSALVVQMWGKEENAIREQYQAIFNQSQQKSRVTKKMNQSIVVNELVGWDTLSL